MPLHTTIPAFLFLLTQLLHATTAVPLVVGENGIFDQEFLASFPQASSYAPAAAGAHNSDADSIAPTPNTPAHSTSYPSWFTSTLLARRLLALSKTGIASTIYPNPLPPKSHSPSSVSGLSIPLPEYIADCDKFLPAEGKEGKDGGEGNPTLLALYVGTTFRNTAAGSNISLSIDWWDHLSSTEPIYPGFPLSPAGLPRATLFGYVEPLSNPAPKDLEECYYAAHPDAKAWAPGKEGSPHASFWAKMVVQQVYWIGGFGDVARIGWLNGTEWKGIREEGSLGGVGDGRGWGDVRLPGEKD